MSPFILQLQQRLQQPLPGPEAQYRLANNLRRSPGPPPPHARQAGVLVLFFPKNDDWQLVLIERESSNPNDRHSGQISFPGGQHDPTDPSLAHTALREAWEEVGAPLHDIQLLGPLTQLYIPVSNFLVHPYVGWLPSAPTFVPQVSEVRQVLEVPLAHFQDPTNLRTTSITLPQGITLHEVPYYHVANRVVWGATAMILGELLAVLEG